MKINKLDCCSVFFLPVLWSQHCVFAVLLCAAWGLKRNFVVYLLRSIDFRSSIGWIGSSSSGSQISYLWVIIFPFFLLLPRTPLPSIWLKGHHNDFFQNILIRSSGLIHLILSRSLACHSCPWSDKKQPSTLGLIYAWIIQPVRSIPNLMTNYYFAILNSNWTYSRAHMSANRRDLPSCQSILSKHKSRWLKMASPPLKNN